MVGYEIGSVCLGFLVIDLFVAHNKIVGVSRAGNMHKQFQHSHGDGYWLESVLVLGCGICGIKVILFRATVVVSLGGPTS